MVVVTLETAFPGSQQLFGQKIFIAFLPPLCGSVWWGPLPGGFAYRLHPRLCSGHASGVPSKKFGLSWRALSEMRKVSDQKIFCLSEASFQIFSEPRERSSEQRQP